MLFMSVFGSFLGFNVDTVGDLSFLLKAVSYRERVLQRSLATRLYNKVSPSPSPSHLKQLTTIR